MLQHVEVRDLESELRQQAAFTVAEAVDIVVELAEVLARTHELGAVNGRVSTSNILITRGAFGSAKLRPAPQSGTTRTNQSARAHLYLSPEQLADTQDLLAPTDIWSLAVVLYELIAGKLPFADAEAIKRGTFTPLRGMRGCPPQIDMAVTSCLQRSPFARTQSVVSFALTIASFGSSRSKSLVSKLKAMEPPASDPTMYKPSEDRESDPTMHEEERHAADDDGATLMVSSAEQNDLLADLGLEPSDNHMMVKPTVPTGFAPLHTPILPSAVTPPPGSARRHDEFSDRTQRISSAQLQELGKLGSAPRGNAPPSGPVIPVHASSNPALAPMMRSPSSPELGTPISNIRMRDGGGALVPVPPPPMSQPGAPAAKSSRLPTIVSVISLLIFVGCVIAAAMILLAHKR